MLWFAGVIVAVLTVLMLDLWLNGHRTPVLAAFEPDSRPLPRLSVIVPALNEAEQIEAAVESMLHQDYSGLELILVNDRSTDYTGAIMAALEERYPDKVRVVTIEQLPPGWLGKNHAVWTGAQQATGEWILFTDADVVFHATCFRRAVAYCEQHGLDHLAMFPRLTSRGYWGESFISLFSMLFQVGERPHAANQPGSKNGVGIGAFNLLRHSTYQQVGTHQAISLRPDDDMRLGKRIRKLGFRQRFASGMGMASVMWYPSVGEAIRGLEKNMFANFDYSVAKTVVMAIVMLPPNIAPYIAIWFTSGAAWWLWLAGLASQWVVLAYAGYLCGNKRALLYAPVHPLLTAVIAYAMLRSMVLALKRGGIYWRGTFYPLSLLRAQTGYEGCP